MLSTNLLRNGSDETSPTPQTLRAGPLSLLYHNGDLRDVRWGKIEILRRVYVAVRDRNWGTVPLQISEENVRDDGDSFAISYTATHHRNEIHFAWRAAIRGERDGTISFDMKGEAQSTFLKNRIGFCVLHPPDCAGAKCRVLHDDGVEENDAFPQFIQPDAPFRDVRALTHQGAKNAWARVDFAGDVFETEDQRNWTDASFKTFCTPLRWPFPVEIERGARVSQSVKLTLQGANAATSSTRSESVSRFQVGENVVGKLPLWGVGLGERVATLAPREVALLKLLQPSHLRVDLRLSDIEYSMSLARAIQNASAIGANLEIALFVSDDAARELDDFVNVLRELKPPLASWLIFHQREVSTGARWIKMAREKLKDYAPDIPLGSGTNAYFTELNRNRPDLQHLDFVTYSANPQVHAFDDASLMETTQMLPVTVASARRFCGDKPLAISPITLKPRFNVVATGDEPETAPGELPHNVDTRQMSLFGAAWTLAAWSHLAPTPLRSLTFYETVGWRGVMESEIASPSPFPAVPRCAFPLFHVLADIGEFRGADVLHSEHSGALKIAGVALQLDQRKRVLLANMTNETQRVEIGGLPQNVVLRVLDESNASLAMREPQRFRAQSETRPTESGQLRLTLRPYATLCIDSET